MKKQDFIDYKNENKLTLADFAKKIGIAPYTLWLFLNTSSKRKSGVMFKLKAFHQKYIEKQKEVTEPMLIDVKTVEEPKEEPCSAQGNFREFRIALEVSLMALKNENVISDETYGSLMLYISQMSDAYEHAVL